MLIVLRLIVFYYFVTTSLCNIEKASEKSDKLFYSSEPKSYKTEYSSGDVGSYSRGGLYAPSAVTTHQGHETVNHIFPLISNRIVTCEDSLVKGKRACLLSRNKCPNSRFLKGDFKNYVCYTKAAGEGCNADELICHSMSTQDRLAIDAIKALHRQLDDDADGIVDLSESDEFLREDLKYQDGYQRRQQAFHRNDDKHISVKELWDAWLRSEVHNWTVEQTVEWLSTSVELPQYASTFIEHRVTGATLPRLAVGNFQFLSTVLGIKDPIHKQKIALKAMDVVLFGPPKDYYHPTKDIILVTLLLGALVGCWWAYRQNKLSRRHLRRMMKDMESLQRAELALEDLQRELEHAKKEQENVATEKLDLERRLLEQAGDGERMRESYSDLEITQLKQELEMLRSELQRAEGELQDRCWSPPVGLQHWLQLTHEIENKSYIKKRLTAEKQLQQAREACEKLRKKRSSLVGAFVSTHGKSIDEVDRSIVEARTSLNEVTAELQERVHRWKQIELLCGFNVINNNGLPYLESVLYRNTPNGRGLKGLGKLNSSQDDLDEDSGSIYSPSAGYFENWKEDSSGSEQGRNEGVDDDGQQETRSLSNNIHFTLGGDAFGDDLSPMPNLPKKSQKNSMTRSQSQDNNVNTSMIDREKEKEYSITTQTKFSQSESNLEGPGMAPRYSHLKKMSRDPSLDLDEIRCFRKVEDHLRKTSDDKPIRRIGKDQPEEDPKFIFIKNFKDKEISEEEKNLGYRQLRDMPEDFRKNVGQYESSNFRRSTSDDLRKHTLKEGQSDSKKIVGGEDSRRVSVEDCRKNVENSRKGRLEEYKKSNNSNSDEKEETHSTDSNSTAADDPETKKRKLKLFGNFRKNKSKLT